MYQPKQDSTTRTRVHIAAPNELEAATSMFERPNPYEFWRRVSVIGMLLIFCKFYYTSKLFVEIAVNYVCTRLFIIYFS
jgi:hypothetical protein